MRLAPAAAQALPDILPAISLSPQIERAHRIEHTQPEVPSGGVIGVEWAQPIAELGLLYADAAAAL